MTGGILIKLIAINR